MKAVAIIPARGGSKRIPRKNIKPFCGKPILSYSIEAALATGLFDEIMVSTEDREISHVARSLGAKVPFFRSDKTSSDFALIVEVLEEVWNVYAHDHGMVFDFLCCIFPTAPLIQPEDLRRSWDLLLERDFDSVFPVVRFGYPILRSLKVENGKATMNWPEFYSSRSQDLPQAYHDVGQFYWIRPLPCFTSKRIFTDNSGVIELPESRVQDIDTEEDWKVAELKYRLINGARDGS